ncbi:MAG: hypothetical protein R3B09_30425 [Nannocystaceae bacterium]
MPLRVGQDIDAWCTKCRLDTTHVVVAMGPDGIKPKRVECTSCNGQHNYRPPKTAKPQQRGAAVSERVIAAAAAQKAMAEATATAKPAGSKPTLPPPAEPRLPPPRPARASRPKSPAKPRAAKSADAGVSASGGSKRNEWSRRIEEMDLTTARTYSMRQTFAVDDLIEHPNFGLGIVTDLVDGSKCGILFESGRRVLAMGHAPAAS